MAKSGAAIADASTKVPKNGGAGTPRSLPIAARGIKTSGDFADFMSAMMSDLVEGRVTPSVGNASCNAGGKLLKMVEMEYKYGSNGGKSNPKKTLTIAFEEKPQSDRE